MIGDCVIAVSIFFALPICQILSIRKYRRYLRPIDPSLLPLAYSSYESRGCGRST